jgi:hypothetical protein
MTANYAQRTRSSRHCCNRGALVGQVAELTDSEKPKATPTESGRAFFARRRSFSLLAAARNPLCFLASHE